MACALNRQAGCPDALAMHLAAAWKLTSFTSVLWMDWTKLKESEERLVVGTRVMQQNTTSSMMYTTKSVYTCLRTEPDQGQSTS